MTTVRDYMAAFDRELAEWPGVRWQYGGTRRHQLIAVSLGDRTASHVFPTSASDHRAIRNSVADLRTALASIGATRNERPKATGPRRQRMPRPLPTPTLRSDAPEPRDPWQELRSLSP